MPVELVEKLIDVPVDLVADLARSIGWFLGSVKCEATYRLPGMTGQASSQVATTTSAHSTASLSSARGWWSDFLFDVLLAELERRRRAA